MLTIGIEGARIKTACEHNLKNLSVQPVGNGRLALFRAGKSESGEEME